MFSFVGKKHCEPVVFCVVFNAFTCECHHQYLLSSYNLGLN